MVFINFCILVLWLKVASALEGLTLPMLRLLSYKAQWRKDFENYLNPVLLVFIEKLILSTVGWVPMCQGFSNFSGFLHHFVLAKLATSSIRVTTCSMFLPDEKCITFHLMLWRPGFKDILIGSITNCPSFEVRH